MAEPLGVNGRVKTQDLLHLAVEKCVQAGHCSTHDAGHGLVASRQRCAGKPAGLMIRRQAIHEELKLIFPFDTAGSHQFLYELEHRHDVPLLWLCELCDQ